MAKKVSEYTTAATVLASGDLFDLTKLVSTGPDVYESQRANANLLAGWNLFGQDQTMPAPRLHNLSNNQLSLTNGRLLLKGSDNIGTDLLKLESLAGTEVFKALNNGTIKISNAFTLPVADGTAGQALLTDGAGAVSFGNVATSSIYTANDTIGSSRVATITDSLTFAGGKLILSSVTDGILLNRLTDLEMASLIATAQDNEVIFNTDKHALYRFDTALNSWVTLAAGFGLVSITNASGEPTFFTDLASATTSANTGDTINLHTDQVLPAQWTINKRITVNMNGFTISFDSAGTDDTIFISYVGSNKVFSFINGGRVVRTGGTYSTTNSLSLHYLVTTDVLNMGDTEFFNDFGTSVYLQSSRTAIGGFIFGQEIALRLGASIADATIRSENSDGIYANNPSSYFAQNCVITASNGSGSDRAGLRNCNVTASVGVEGTLSNISNNTIVSSSHGVSGGSLISGNTITAGDRGISAGANATITGNTITAVNQAVYSTTGSNIYSNPFLKSTGNTAVSGSQFDDVINNTIITTSNNSSHHGIVTGNTRTHYISGNYIEVANTGANAIVQSGASTLVFSVDNTFKGMTTPLNLSNGNQQTNAEDSTGSILIG